MDLIRHLKLIKNKIFLLQDINKKKYIKIIVIFFLKDFLL